MSGSRNSSEASLSSTCSDQVSPRSRENATAARLGSPGVSEPWKPSSRRPSGSTRTAPHRPYRRVAEGGEHAALAGHPARRHRPAIPDLADGLLEVRYGIGRPIYIRWWKWFISNPWYLIPGLFVIEAVLCYNFVGDGVRDAADPFSHR